MLDRNDIMETIKMISEEHLDIRTVTMGISLLSCAGSDADAVCEKVYEKIEEAQIWIPYYEVRRYMSSKQTRFWNQWLKQKNEHDSE